MKTIFNLTILLFIFSGQSCITKDLETTESSLLGNWVEKHPIYGRTELIFEKEKQMIKKLLQLLGFHPLSLTGY